uniref:RING-type domain-containing protein n=1 Tax=Acrobeloides nanus TaxID=290746 RepID=A0A914CP07_9BILA
MTITQVQVQVLNDSSSNNFAANDSIKIADVNQPDLKANIQEIIENEVESKFDEITPEDFSKLLTEKRELAELLQDTLQIQETLQKQNQAILIEKSTLTKEKQELAQENQTLRNQILCLEKECYMIENLYEKYDSLQGDNFQLEKELNLRDDKIKILEELKGENYRLQNEIKVRNRIITQEKTNLQNRITVLEKELGIAKAQRQVWEENYNKLLKNSNAMKGSMENLICVICLDEHRQCIFLPCYHMVCCQECASTTKICSICRAEINGILKIYK